jgi:hypothetical protein
MKTTLYSLYKNCKLRNIDHTTSYFWVRDFNPRIQLHYVLELQATARERLTSLDLQRLKAVLQELCFVSSASLSLFVCPIFHSRICNLDVKIRHMKNTLNTILTD